MSFFGDVEPNPPASRSKHMNDEASKRKLRPRQFRLLGIFLATALIAIPIATYTNAKTNFDRDFKAVEEINDQITRPIGPSPEALYDFGSMAMSSFSVEWEPTLVGKLSSIKIFQRATAVHLHSHETAGKIPDATNGLGALNLLILRGSFDQDSVKEFRNSNPDVEIINLQ